MATVHSTGALSPEEHAAQDKRYAEGHQYDYIIIGTGIAALTVGSLLANTGKKVCMLEAHDIPGGYGHSFKMGEYHFCAQIHYVWGCGPGNTVNSFLKRIGLENELEFVTYDANGYDHMALPDGKTVNIPFGFDKLLDNIDEAYPGHREKVKKFLDIIDRIYYEERHFPSTKKLGIWDVLTKGWKFMTLLKYRNKTLQNVFDDCRLPKEIQAIFAANAGDFAEPPEHLSILAYAGLFGGYNMGTFYPKKHFKYYVDRLATFITDHEGCHIYYETPVSKINIEGDKVSSVETANGKRFTAENFICNADPQSTAKNMIGWDKFPKKYQKPLSYEYSTSGIMVYLGLKDIDLSKYGIGSFNIWHLEDWDMNKMWKDGNEGRFDKSWFFMSTATMHSNEGGVAPEGSHIMEIATFVSYEYYRDLKEKDPKQYRKEKMELGDHLIDLVAKYYIPDIRDYIEVKVVGTPSTNFDYVRAPKGNSYGSRMIPSQAGLGRLKANTPWPNFFWCNASSGFAGFHGTTGTGLNLYMNLTGDHFYNSHTMAGKEESIAYARKKWEEQNPHVPITK